MISGFYVCFSVIGLFILVGVVFSIIGFILSKILRPTKIVEDKYATYECGAVPIGSPWVQFSFRFYLIAIAFIIFDVEAIFLFPWAVVFHTMKKIAFIEMGIFLVILFFGLAYIWKNGDLSWVKHVIKNEDESF